MLRSSNIRLISIIRTGERKILWFFNWGLAWALAWFFPYGIHALRSTVRIVYYAALVAVPLLVLFNILLPVIGVQIVVDWSHPLHTVPMDVSVVGVTLSVPALAFAAWYLLGVFTYHPSDKKKYRADHAPDNKCTEWMRLTTTLAATVLPTGYFALAYYAGVSGWAAAPLTIVTFVLLRKWRAKLIPLTFHDSMNTPGRKKESTQFSKQTTDIWGLFALWLVALTVAMLVGGVGAAFAVHGVAMLFLARRLRWLAYEDKLGFKPTDPNITAWGLVARVPLMYAMVAALYAGAVTQGAVVASFAPLVAGGSYLAYRYWTNDGEMALPVYGDYEQMTTAEEKRHRERLAHALLGRGKPEAEVKRFARKASLLNSRFKQVERAINEARGDAQTPLIREVPENPERFDPQSVQSMLDEIDVFLRSHPSDAARVKLRDARREFRELEEFYEEQVR